MIAKVCTTTTQRFHVWVGSLGPNYGRKGHLRRCCRECHPLLRRGPADNGLGEGVAAIDTLSGAYTPHMIVPNKRAIDTVTRVVNLCKAMHVDINYM